MFFGHLFGLLIILVLQDLFEATSGVSQIGDALQEVNQDLMFIANFCTGLPKSVPCLRPQDGNHVLASAAAVSVDLSPDSQVLPHVRNCAFMVMRHA